MRGGGSQRRRRRRKTQCGDCLRCRLDDTSTPNRKRNSQSVEFFFRSAPPFPIKGAFVFSGEGGNVPFFAVFSLYVLTTFIIEATKWLHSDALIFPRAIRRRSAVFFFALAIFFRSVPRLLKCPPAILLAAYAIAVQLLL